MTNEEAIKTAIEYEKRVTAVYDQAASAAVDEAGKKVFSALAEEERGHVDYLEHKLKQLVDTGVFTSGPLKTVVPSVDQINVGIGKMEKQEAPPDRSEELEFLRQALVAERETSAFYERMVEELDPAGKELFRHFLAIEQGHQIIVQAEIDALTGVGFWFDFQEFNLEAG